MREIFLRAALAGAVAVLPCVATAGETWEGLRAEVYGDRPMLDGTGIIEFSAPSRPEDQSSVPVSAKAKLSDGRTIKAVTFIVDENPSPVAAAFELGEGRSEISIGTKLRFNSATDVRVVVEASDGALYMAERHTKFAGGQAACAAPPTGDPAEIAASTGRMQFVHAGDAASRKMTQLRPKARLELSHPNHTGMVLDQITLLYIPLKMVSGIEARQGDDLVFSMTGSITLSQNPAIDFDYRVNGATQMTVTARDTDGGEWTKSFPIGHGS